MSGDTHQMITNTMSGNQAPTRPKRLAVGKEYPLFVPTNKKPVAGVTKHADLTVWLHKTIQASRHLVSTPQAIAFDVRVFEEAENLGATQIRVNDSETGLTYTTDVATFRQWCFKQDRGYGKQLFLRLVYWSIDGDTPEYQREEERQAAQRGEHQLEFDLLTEEVRRRYV